MEARRCEHSAGKSYTYTSENLLSAASGGGASSATLTYDPLMRLYQDQLASGAVTRFAYDGTDMIAEYDGGNALRTRTVFGPGTDEPLVQYDAAGNRTWLTADERGSIIALSDDTGTVTQIDRYDEYGKPQPGNLGRFQYTGQAWLDDLGTSPASGQGLYYYKSRMYAPHLGRFMQPDPIGYAAGLNLYAYVLNDPLNLVDPLGLQDSGATVTACRYGGKPPNCAPPPAPSSDFPSNLSDLLTFLGVGAANPTVVVIGSRVHHGHDYTIRAKVCNRPLTVSQMRDVLSKFSLPGHSGDVATDRDYIVYQGIIPGGRVNVDFADNGLSVRNTTLFPHFFAGQIQRQIYSERSGTFITTRGMGSAQFLGVVRDWLNQLAGPIIFERLNEDAAAYAKQAYQGC